jgi:hypothetical protein
MQWQTLIPIPGFPLKITYRAPVFFLGSCFAANIGQAMQQRRFPVAINPFGVVYNPLSIAQSIQRLRSGQPFSEEETVDCHGLWTSFQHHSRFSHPDKAVFLQQANAALQQGTALWKEAAFTVVSLGTSWAYRHRERNCIVNNCHKFPAAQFERILLPAEDTVRALATEIAAQPSRTWIFTVSPIRHWKDGAHGNQLSKAHLLIAIDRLQQQFPNVHYFPAYELMMDELRDYRFYADDMLHPSDRAVAYIWQRFAEAAFDEETLKIIPEIEKIIAAQQHRPLHPDTDAGRKFAAGLKKQMQAFASRYPFIDIS